MSPYRLCERGALVRNGLLRACLPWLICLLMTAWSASAFAHAALIGSEPDNQSSLRSLPASVLLRFNEPVSPLFARIVGPDGRIHTDLETQATDGTVRVHLPSLKEPGNYALSWRMVSADGHPVGGSLVFSVGDARPATAPEAEPHPRASLDTAIWMSRLVLYLGLFFGIGSTLYWPRSEGRMSGAAWWATWAGVAALVAGFGLQGLDALDLPFDAILTVRPWRAAMHTSYGPAAVLAAAALLLGLHAWRSPSASRLKRTGLLACVLLALALSSSGHAGSAQPSWLSRPAVWLHAMAVVAWLGVLWPLARMREQSARDALQTFSRLAPYVVAGIILSGSVLAWLQLGTPASLWQTDYGRVLAIKLALVLLLLGLGAYNRYRLTQAVLAGDSEARRRMRQVAAAELLIAALALGTVALWRFTPPPRALTATTANAVISAQAHGDAAMAQLAFTPASPGQAARLLIHLTTHDGHAFAAQEVTVGFSAPEAGLEAIELHAAPQGQGTWLVDDLRLPPRNDWLLRVDVLVSDFERIHLNTRLATFP